MWFSLNKNGLIGRFKTRGTADNWVVEEYINSIGAFPVIPTGWDVPGPSATLTVFQEVL